MTESLSNQKKGEELDLTPIQIDAISLLAAGNKHCQVAEKIGVSPQTISVWHRNPIFVYQLNSLKWEILNTAQDKLRALIECSIEELGNLVKNANNEEIKRKAIIDVLELTGIKNPNSGVYAWGIGSTEIEDILKEIDR